MTMNDHDWKNQELNRLLLKKWGLLNEKKKPDFLDLDKDGDTEESMESAAEEELEERRRRRDDDDQEWSYEPSHAGGVTPQTTSREKSSRYGKEDQKKKERDRKEVARKIRSRKSEGLEEYGTVGQYASRGRETQKEREQRETEEILAAREKRSKKEGLEEDCPPAELPAHGIDAAEPEALTATDITDLQNLLDKLANTLAAEPGMELAGGEAPSEEESPIVMRQEEELREIVRGVITRLREKKIVR